MGFDDCTEERLWTEEETTILLRIAATSFGQAVQRTRAEAALLQSQERSRELLGEAERQARQLALLQEVQQAVARDLELPALFKQVTEAIARHYGYDLVAVYRLEGETLLLEHQIGYPEVIPRLPLNRGVMGRVARTGRAVSLEDATQDPDFLAAFPGIHSEVCVPLQSHGQVIGVLNVESTSQTLGAPDLELIQAVAVQLGLALERADLYASLKQSETLYHTLVETSPDGVWLLDGELRLVYGNTRLLKVLGAPGLEAILGRSALEFVHPEDRKEARETALLASQERVPFVEQKHLRLGGDEFALLLPNVDESGALEAARRMLGVLEAPFWIAGQNVYLSASLGLALYPRDGKTLDELMRSADVAMYQAKQNRTRIAFHQAELNPYTRERLGLITDLRQALAAPQTGESADPHGSFRLHYQPILELKSGRFSCYEALLRWQHPRQGLISPGQFVPLAETAGLIQGLDRWALSAAIQDSKQMSRAVSVNLSAKPLSEAGLAQAILGLLERHALRPSQLWLEVTETALMEKQGQSAANLQTLARSGVRIALDDFGTGYSSLAYLKHLPVQVLKIDRSFVGGIGKHPDEEIALSILRLAKSLGLATLAEGVETPEQLEWLRQAGCDYAQGYHIQRPEKN